MTTMTTMTTRTPLTDPEMDEYDARPAVCTRNPSHTSTNRVAHCSGWWVSDLHGWLCPGCLAELRAEKALEVACPEWCTNCGGYDIDGGGFTHRRHWPFRSRPHFLSIYQLINADGEIAECGATFDDLEALDAEDLVLVAMMLAEAAAVMRTHNLAPLGRAS